MVRALNDTRVAQPDDVLFVVTDFTDVMIVRLKLVRLCMTVNQRMRVFGVSLVQVLARHRRGTDKPRHDGESADRAPKPSKHKSIMPRELGCS